MAGSLYFALVAPKSGWSVGSSFSTGDEQSNRQAACGRLDQHKLSTLGCSPDRLSFAEALLIASRGRETSISFLRGVKSEVSVDESFQGIPAAPEAPGIFGGHLESPST